MRRLLLVALLAVTGCAGAEPVLTTAAAPAPDPFPLVGWWTVAGTDQTVLADPSAFEVVDGCRTVAGTWRADPDVGLVALADTGTPCPEDGDAPLDAPDWLAGAADTAADGADLLLLDRGGVETARLTPRPPVAGSGAVDPARPPTEEELRGAGRAEPVPPALRAAEPAELVGRWIPADLPAGPFAEFAADGTWSGSDGCNGAAGSWLAGAAGGFLATAPSVSTLVACPGVDVAAQLGLARRAAFDGPVLVLLDAGGGEIGRLRRG